MTVVSLSAAWKQGRAARARQRPRRSVGLAAVSLLARKLPLFKRVRTALMQWAGAGSICYGLFTWSLLAGFIGTGMSLFVLEALGGERA